jgi:sterol desaturase/sphingolipid hydroxylase (fatty acid hydroxylase superfamily)
MDTELFAGLLENYEWKLSLITAIGIAATTIVGKRLLMLVPAFRSAAKLNRQAFEQKMARPNYAANQRWNRKWGLFYWLVIFVLILPFCLTAKPEPWWQIGLDIFAILMVYDFFYYLVHRFLFHDGNFLGGPLMHIHAVHHRQHNPCRGDSSFIHPLEVAMGLGLYIGVIFVLSRFMGDFHVGTVIVTWVAFSQINLHNHDLWTADRFPFGYLSYASQMHHNHHARFTGGNFATISPLFDWMFGTLDHGQGYGAKMPGKPAEVRQ